MPTDNHRYNTPSRGDANWNVPLNENAAQLDTDVEVRDTDANRDQYAPKDGALFRATDTGAIYLGDGRSWSKMDIDVVNASLTGTMDMQGRGRLKNPRSIVGLYDRIVQPTDSLGTIIGDASGGERFLLTPGRHAPTADIDPSEDEVTIEGHGESTVIDHSENGTSIDVDGLTGFELRNVKVTGRDVDRTLIHATSCEKSMFENVTIDTVTGSGLSRGMSLNDGRENVVRNVAIDTVENQGLGLNNETGTEVSGVFGKGAYGNPADVVSLYRSKNLSINNVRIDEPNPRVPADREGTYRGLSVFDCTECVISNCSISETDDFAYWVEGSSEIGFANCTGTGVRSTGSGLNFKDSTNCWVLGGVYSNNVYDGIAVGDHHGDGGETHTSRDITIVGAVCKNNNRTNDGRTGIRVIDGTNGSVSENVTIIGCIAGDDQGTPTQDGGIRTANSSGNNLVIGNRCEGNVTNQYELAPSDATRASDTSAPGLNL